MDIRETKRGVEMSCTDDFDLERIFECGQCFRWNANESGVYTGVARGRALTLLREDDTAVFLCGRDEFESVWRDYFDLDRVYGDIRRSLCSDEYMTRASEFGAGLRILRQDRWEALCSFIVSQCNNIPRIKKIVETLCGLYGESIEYRGAEYHAFPSAERLAGLREADLAPLRCGYRAPYIIGAAEAVASGALDLDALAEGEPDNAIKELKRLNGVGDKVASCAVLFGLQMLDAFPIDVWMRRAIKEHYGQGFDYHVFSPYAGIAQQYMFYYARSGGGE